MLESLVSAVQSKHILSFQYVCACNKRIYAQCNAVILIAIILHSTLAPTNVLKLYRNGCKRKYVNVTYISYEFTFATAKPCAVLCLCTPHLMYTSTSTTFLPRFSRHLISLVIFQVDHLSCISPTTCLVFLIGICRIFSYFIPQGS